MDFLFKLRILYRNSSWLVSSSLVRIQRFHFLRLTTNYEPTNFISYTFNMKFGLILGGVTVGTLILIFGVYFIFLKKDPLPSAPFPSVQPQASVESLPSPLPSPSEAIPSPAASAQPGSVVRITPRPSAKSTIGSITLLQDGTSANSSSTSGGGSNISGTIGFTGTAPTDTSIVILARQNGSSDSYKTVISGISASNGASWSWTGATSGTTYDMVAVLKGVASNGVATDYAMSQTYAVTAPAYSQIFSLNSASAPSQPSGTITTTCSNKNNNLWGVTVTFPSVSGVQWYKLQVGTSSGASDIMNISQAASSMSPSSTTSFTDSVLYYAQFAVANTANPTDAQYSAFSEPQTVKCP